MRAGCRARVAGPRLLGVGGRARVLLLSLLLWMLAGPSSGASGWQGQGVESSVGQLAEVTHLYRIDQALESIEPAHQRASMAKCILKARSGKAHIVLSETEASHAAVQCLASLCEINVTASRFPANSSIAYSLHAPHNITAASTSSFTDVCTRVAELLLEDVISNSSTPRPSGSASSPAPPPDDRSLVLSEFKRQPGRGAGQPLTTRAHRLWQLYSTKFRTLRDIKVRLYDAARAPPALVSQHCLHVLASGGQLRELLGGVLCAEVFRKDGAGLVALDLAGSGANRTMLELGLFPSCNLYVR